MAICNKVVILVICFSTISIVNGTEKCGFVSIAQDYNTCAKEHPTVSKLMDEKSHISGNDLVNVFNHFCAARRTIHDCVKDRIAVHGCLNSESTTAKLHEDYIKSEDFCDGNKAIDLVHDLFNDLPQVHSSHAENECLETITVRREVCKSEISLALSLEGKTSLGEQFEGLVESMLCTYKFFGSEECPLDKGLLMTVMVYPEIIVPPLLGVNVTDTLYGMALYYKQHG